MINTKIIFLWIEIRLTFILPQTSLSHLQDKAKLPKLIKLKHDSIVKSISLILKAFNTWTAINIMAWFQNPLPRPSIHSTKKHTNSFDKKLNSEWKKWKMSAEKKIIIIIFKTYKLCYDNEDTVISISLFFW